MGAKAPAAEVAERSHATRNFGYTARTPRDPTAAHTRSTQYTLNGKATEARSASVHTQPALGMACVWTQHQKEKREVRGRTLWMASRRVRPMPRRCSGGSTRICATRYRTAVGYA